MKSFTPVSLLPDHLSRLLDRGQGGARREGRGHKAELVGIVKPGWVQSWSGDAVGPVGRPGSQSRVGSNPGRGCCGSGGKAGMLLFLGCCTDPALQFLDL